jgi:uncharacterized membrane protein HdeD (DUF308 family)
VKTFELGNRRSWININSEDLAHLSKKWGLILTSGILFVALGIIAMSLAGLTTIMTMAIFGWVLVFASAAQMVEAFSGREGSRFVLELISAVLYFVAGFFLIRHPGISAVMLTFLLAPLFLALGTIRSITAVAVRPPQWGWQFVSGLVTLWLGYFLLSNSAATGLWLVGTFIGLELFFEGVALVSFALAVRPKKIAR